MKRTSGIRTLCVTACILWASLVFVPCSAAQSWQTTGGMNYGHETHTATLLPDGRVLIAGGGGGTTWAELYDPSTGTFSPTGAMHVARAGHTATLLSNGKVLIAGGGSAGAQAAELYDPQTGVFTLTGSMAVKRVMWSTATLLANGKVLITGGWDFYWSQIDASAELYDPATGLFGGTSSMSIPREHHSATLLHDGRVLIAGGLTNGPLYEVTTKSCEIYDPTTGTFSPTGNLNDSRMHHTATLLPDGKVLMAAGVTQYAYVVLKTAELFDPATGTFAWTGSLNQIRYGHTATLLRNGTLLVAGGNAYGVPGSEGSAEVYLPVDAGGAFSPTSPMKDDRAGFTATRLLDGRVLMAGGYSGGGVYLSSAELYSKVTGGYAPTGPMAGVRVSHAAVLLPDGKVLVTGGTTDSAVLGSAELYDPATGTFSATGAMTAARASHTATLLGNGKVLVAGGYAGAIESSAELYDPGSGAFSPTGSMTTARAGHTATLLSSGEVLIVGGTDAAGWPLASAELYDPVSGKFSPTGALGTTRVEHTATLLHDNRVLIAGGYGQVGGGPLSPLDSAEIYDRAAGSFSSTGSMLTVREYPTATRLLNGKVLITGGTVDLYAQPTLAWAELFDPDTGAFSLVGSMGTARVHHRATPLDDGTVLIAGGYGWGNYLFFSELFEAGPPVPAGWVHNASTGHDYRIVECTSWWDCQNQAIAAGGYLVTINDAAEQEWLVRTFGGTYFYWIGLLDEAAEGTFAWVTGEALAYTNWAPGEPNDWGGAEDYALMNWAAPGWWNDAYLYSTNVTMGIVEKGLPLLPDLVQSSVGNPPPTGTPGYEITVNDTVLNQGTVPAGASATRYYLSFDTTVSRFDIRIGSRSVPALAVSGTSAGTTGVTIPGDAALGTYYLIACADYLGAVAESNETNNCTASAGTIVIGSLAPPDLVAVAVADPPATASAGGNFGVQDTTENQGGSPAGASVTRYYLSTDTSKGGGDTLLTGTRALPALAAGGHSTGGVTVTIPAIAPGAYHVLACADDTGLVAEGNETNNCIASAGTVTIGLQGKPAASDFDGDKKSDVFWRHAGHGELWLWPMNGAARTAETYVRTVGDTNWEIRGVGDQTGDGKADLLWRNKVTGQIYFWRMDGSTRLEETYVATVDPAYDIVGAGDFSGDGKSDILWRNTVNGEVWIWLMNGASPTSGVYVDRVNLAYTVRGVGDFDADGKADIVWHNGTTGEVWVWLMDGTARLAQTWVGNVPDTAYQIYAVGDFTGDGKADIAWWHAVYGEVWIWTMNGAARTGQDWVANVPDTSYRIAGSGDYDGDGKADLLWWNLTNGQVWVWLMNGPVRVSESFVAGVPDTGYRIVR